MSRIDVRALEQEGIYTIPVLILEFNRLRTQKVQLSKLVANKERDGKLKGMYCVRVKDKALAETLFAACRRYGAGTSHWMRSGRDPARKMRESYIQSADIQDRT